MNLTPPKKKNYPEISYIVPFMQCPGVTTKRKVIWEMYSRKFVCTFPKYQSCKHF